MYSPLTPPLLPHPHPQAGQLGLELPWAKGMVPRKVSQTVTRNQAVGTVLRLEGLGPGKNLLGIKEVGGGGGG